jgi:hypothetical protein
MKIIYSSPNSLLVDNLRNVLENEQIECIVKNRQLSGAVGEVPPIEAWLELEVLHDADVERAEALVVSALSNEAAAASWRCEKCGEEIPGEIATCWNCAASAEAPTEHEPLPGGLLYRAVGRRMRSSHGFSWLAMAAMILALLYMLLSI